MKFGKCLSASAQELPEDWRQHVVHYSHLKKCINRIVAELEEIGLANLAAEYSEESIDSTQPFKLIYSFIGTVENFSPNIEVIVEENAQVVTPELEAISTKLNSLAFPIAPEETVALEQEESIPEESVVTDQELDKNEPIKPLHEPSEGQHIEEPESDHAEWYNNTTPTRALNIVLPTDSEFFGNLSSSINGLTKFELDMKEACSDKIIKLASLISHTASPYSKDMYIWREIFNLYLDASIWMVNNSMWQKPQSIEKTREQYQWFIREITRLSLNKKFRTRDSTKALEQFMMLNHDLLSIMQFHDLNQTAVRKIIKKHDKRTHLSAKSWFVDLMAPSMLFKGNLSKALLSALHSELLIIIPQPDDYQCPICLSISWKPIRLRCGHVFCVQCMIGAQRRKINDCPLCRAPDSVTEANTGNLDVPRMNFMKLYFPREIKAKQKENDYEQAREDVKVIGINSNNIDSGCAIM